MEEIEYVGKCLVVNEEKKRTLVVGDLHLGYEEALNKAGVFVSRQMFKEMIKSFDLVLERVGKIDRVVVLGDIKHDFGNILRQEWEDVLKLVSYFKERAGEVIIIKGNHDKIVEPLAKQAEVKVEDYFISGKYCFLHGDRDFSEIYEKEIKYWIIGHAHPAVTFSDGVKVEKYKCFLEGEYKGKRVIIVPSFVEYSEGSDPRENDLGIVWNLQLGKFRVRVIAENLKVLDFGLLRNL